MRMSLHLPRFFIILTLSRQWGNVLVLLAAYRDPILNGFIEGKTLRDLLEKTISFLKLYAQPSSALYMDHRILEHVGALVKLIPQGPNTITSFSSATSMDTTVGTS
jgi:hypothetical protein